MNALDPAGPAAHTIAGMAWSLFIGSALIFAAVMGLLAFAMRARGKEINAKWWIVGGGLVFPITVLSALMVYTMIHSRELTRAPPADALVVSVTGKMWWWEVRMRHPSGNEDVVLANEIRIPTGRPVVLSLASSDVIHSFWVPELGGKMDMVPGRTNHLRLQADKPGVYRGQCAEYCGMQHAKMALHVIALTPPEFDAWLAAQAQPAVAPVTPLALRGREVFMAQRCSACHTVRGVTEEGRLGPDLTHVASRLYLGAGVLRNEAGAAAEWVTHTQDHKPGARMPSFNQLDAASLEAVSAYLEQLK